MLRLSQRKTYWSWK